jgi:hypothetical protein
LPAHHYPLLIVVLAVRAATACAFAAQVVTVATTAGAPEWGIWTHLGLGYRVWDQLGGWNATLAFACLIPSLILVLVRGVEAGRDIRWCVWLNIATIALRTLVPALAMM